MYNCAQYHEFQRLPNQMDDTIAFSINPLSRKTERVDLKAFTSVAEYIGILCVINFQGSPSKKESLHILHIAPQ